MLHDIDELVLQSTNDLDTPIADQDFMMWLRDTIELLKRGE